MKEFVEKLIGRLEELRRTTIFDAQCIFENSMVDKCIKIVKEFAKEYKDNDFCEWNCGSQIKSLVALWRTSCGNHRIMQKTDDYNVCPYCGKNIKIASYQTQREENTWFKANITPEMKADLLDCIKETKIPGGGKDCNTCSIDKTNYHGKAFCEVEQIKEKILHGAEAVTLDAEKYSAGTSMERITKYINGGKAVCFAKCEKECVCGYMMDDVTCDCEVVQSAKKRLDEYEALGVTPEQIREIDRLYTEKCKEVAELEKRLQNLKGDMK